MQNEFLSISMTVSGDTRNKKNIFYNKWVQMYREKLESARRQVEGLRKTALGSSPDLVDAGFDSVLRTFDELLDEKAYPTILKSTIAEHAERHAVLRQQSDKIFAPETVYLENDPTPLELQKHIVGSSFFQAKYGDRSVLANFIRTGVDTVAEKMEFLMQHGDMISMFPDDFVKINRMGTLYRGEVIFIVCLFFDAGSLFVEKPRSADTEGDVAKCVAKFQKLNEIGCLHLQANKLLAVETTDAENVRSWKLLGPGLKLNNASREFFDASAFYVELFENHGYAELLSRDFCRHLFEMYPLELLDPNWNQRLDVELRPIYERHIKNYRKWKAHLAI